MWMNVWLEVSVITTRHVTILMDHTVVNVTKVSLEMERTVQVILQFNFYFYFSETFYLREKQNVISLA